MIESKLTLDIIHANLEGVKHQAQLLQQMEHLEEVEYEHTGSGLLIFIEYRKAAKGFWLTDEQLQDLFGEGPTELSSVILINEALGIRAETTVHFTNGLIDRVEIWNQEGEYPEEDLEEWKLERIEN